ncbi:MAG: hypothetical protein IJN49_07240, partial [Clostridia bacterium]|nr:hypothetical protein [Clostridia bacterium]
MDFNENYVVVTINLTSVDNALDTLWSFNGIKGIAGGDIVRVKLKYTVSVIGNAGYQKSTMAYDSVDN